MDSREINEQLLSLLKEKEDRIKFNYIRTLFPDDGITLDGCKHSLSRRNYKKHIEFIKAGSTHIERAFIAGNRCGKTLTGLYELICHCLGWYPEWWEGKKFTRPVLCWLVGDRGDSIRDSMQRDLLGRDGLGTGLIPRDKLLSTSALQGTPNGIGTYNIQHSSGGISTIIVKTYNSGQAAFEAAAVDVAMLDEEVPLDIYVEVQMRTLTTGGTVYVTFTPDSGLTDTVLHFFDKPKPGEPERFVVMVGWNDVPHLSEERKKQMLSVIPPHLRDVKTKGVPYLGSGAIYPIPEEDIKVSPFKIPAYWPKWYAFDPGWNKTAASWWAYNPEEDCMYMYAEYYRGQAEPEVHAANILSHGKWMVGVADPHGSKSGKGVSDQSFLDAYSKYGLDLILSNPSGPGSVDIGINEVYSRLSSGRMKIFSTCQNWFYEYRMYRRNDKGQIVATHNHLMDTTRYSSLNGINIMSVEHDESEWDKRLNVSYDEGRSSITGY